MLKCFFVHGLILQKRYITLKLKHMGWKIVFACLIKERWRGKGFHKKSIKKGDYATRFNLYQTAHSAVETGLIP